MERIEFQINAVESLITQFKRLWANDEYQIPITLKAPTGSGKTYITEKFICDILNQPDWDIDVAFIWITFSDDLAMQSRDKFMEYFPTELPGRLLTVNDLSQGVLNRKDILFLNWQKLVSKAADNRLRRRPDDERERKESGYYWEDVIENTHKDGRKVIMVIDESHKNVTEASMRDVINPVNPKIIIKVSATPETEPSASDVNNNRAGVVEVSRQDVIDAGMIKEHIVCQTEEDLKRMNNKNLDEALISLAIEKRQELCMAIDKFHIKVNPLVIIQLPNDDNASQDVSDKTKEEVVIDILVKNGVPQERIARWFADTPRPANLEHNESPYDFLLFKTAAGTGWDCPRAQILIMFREIHSETFQTQTIGRIVRVPVRGQQASSIFRTGYIYTNYSRQAVIAGDYSSTTNRPKINISQNIKGNDYVIDPELKKEYVSRVDYGDLGKSWEFQQCLVNTFNSFFGITKEDSFGQAEDKLRNKGLELACKFTQKVVVDANFYDYDNIGLELKKAKDLTREVSPNDVQKLFTLECVNLLREQTDNDCKIGNIARSWSTLKSSIRFWMRNYALRNESEDSRYRIFLYDLRKNENSLFRHLVTMSLKEYNPILKKQIEERQKQEKEKDSVVFSIPKTIAFTEDYEAFDMIKCLYRPFYLRREYNGRDTELPFAQYLDGQGNIDWWIKNGDSGKDWLSFRYFNEQSQITELFYPDWIVHLNNGTLGIFDTKAGFTAASIETKCKAEALQKKISKLNSLHSGNIKYVGGIIRKENGVWYYNDHEIYSYQKGNTEGWKLLSSLFIDEKSEEDNQFICPDETHDTSRFKSHLPLYPFHIACGILESGGTLAEDGVERWIDVSSCSFKPNENMFVVHAKGDSMMPKIHNGDLCVFERYTGGSREGEIVLAQVFGKDDDYLCGYTIKKYHSEKTVSNDSWEHLKIELLPINTDGYSPIVIDDVENYRVLGLLRHVITD